LLQCSLLRSREVLARGRWLSCVALAVAITACRRHATEVPLDARITSDLQTLCSRVKARSVVAWGQATMMTDEVGAITQRIDQGDEAARCELARLMQQHAPEACEGSIETLVRSCDQPSSVRAPGERTARDGG
jgi:hypothetical protein